MRSILSISSHVAVGRVGQSISTFAFARLGFGVMAVPSVLYPVMPAPGAPRGVGTPQEIFDLLLKGVDQAGGMAALSALHIGYLRTPEQVASVARAIALVREKSPGAPVLLDPILGDAPGGLYVPKETADAVVAELAPRADILTPNLFELGYLARRAIASESDAVIAARALKVRVVVVTSAPDTRGRASTLLVAPDGAHRLVSSHFVTAPHGTGDLLAALFLARTLNGETPLEGLAAAISSVHGLIDAANAVGMASLPHIEHQELLVAPLPCVQIERVA